MKYGIPDIAPKSSPNLPQSINYLFISYLFPYLHIIYTDLHPVYIMFTFICKNYYPKKPKLLPKLLPQKVQIVR